MELSETLHPGRSFCKSSFLKMCVPCRSKAKLKKLSLLKIPTCMWTRSVRWVWPPEFLLPLFNTPESSRPPCGGKVKASLSPVLLSSVLLLFLCLPVLLIQTPCLLRPLILNLVSSAKKPHFHTSPYHTEPLRAPPRLLQHRADCTVHIPSQSCPSLRLFS